MNEQLKTPYFLIYEEKLRDNIMLFQGALNNYWPNSEIAYSIKTNSLPWILKFMNLNNVMVEAVSIEEYDLAKMCGYDDTKIVFNGPIKKENDLKNSFEKKSIINIDSQFEIEYIKNNKPTHSGNLGVRININPQVFNKGDIGYLDDGFRFGYSEENGKLKEVFDLIQSIYGDIPFGLHLHCNSITRSLDVYKSIAKYASTIIEKYHLNPSFIDIGGGFFGGVPGTPTAVEYIKIITNQLKDFVDISQTKLIIEPGSALIGSVVDLYTSVVDVKQTCFGNFVTTDGSRINIDPLWKKKSYLYSIESQSKVLMITKQIICGYTCMDHDRLMIIENEKTLQVGDKILYHRVGAYTMTFGGPFIRYFPDVYVKDNNNIVQVRQRMDLSSYYNIQSNN